METGLDVLSRAASYVERACDIDKTVDSMPTSRNRPVSTTTTAASPVELSSRIDEKSSSDISSPTKIQSVDNNRSLNRQASNAMDNGNFALDNCSPLKKRPRARSRSVLTDDADADLCDRLASDDGAAPPYKTMRILTSQSSHDKTAPIDAQDLPLNLTTTTLSTTVAYTSATSGMDTSTTYTQLRPSVIIRAAHVLLDDTPAAYPQSPSNRSPGSPAIGPCRREVLTAVDDASSVDEHFRRSLGRDYPEYPACPAQRSSPTDLPPIGDGDHDSVDGSVDDHFARSLGQTKWNEIKSKSVPSRPSSVDDHFAKALGEQWASIKAQQENNEHRLITPS